MGASTIGLARFWLCSASLIVVVLTAWINTRMLSAQIEAVRSRMRSEIGGLRSEIEALRAEMRKRVRGTGAQAHQADHRTGSSHRAPGRATRPDSHALDRSEEH